MSASPTSPSIARLGVTAGPANALALDDAPLVAIQGRARGRYGRCPLSALQANPHAVQIHSKRQVAKLARSIAVTGQLAPVIADERFVILAGHARVAVARAAGETEIPVLQVLGLSEAQKRTYLLADNRVSQDGRLDRKALAQQIPELALLLTDEGLTLEDTGFEMAELDELVLAFEDGSDEPDEAIDPGLLEAPVIVRAGDVFALGEHRLAVGDAREPQVLDQVVAGHTMAAAFLDPPYNVPARAIGGRGRVQHPDFAFGSGEMSGPDYVAFLQAALANAARVSSAGAVHFVCIDWAHLRALSEAAEPVYETQVNLVVWNKTNAGQGGLYRSQHELIGVYRVGGAKHRDNVQMGRFGRNRSNVWTYAGANAFGKARMADLAAHPTVKPIALVADAIRDVTRRDDWVLDSFLGAGTTLLAGERIGRRVAGIEIDPRYAQIAIRRWEAFTGRIAIETGSGLDLDALAERRADGPASATAAVPMPRIRTQVNPSN